MVSSRDRHSPLPQNTGKGGPPVQEVGLGHVTCCGLELPAWWTTQGSSMGFCCCPQEECVLWWPWEGAPGKGVCCASPCTPGAWSPPPPASHVLHGIRGPGVALACPMQPGVSPCVPWALVVALGGGALPASFVQGV